MMFRCSKMRAEMPRPDGVRPGQRNYPMTNTEVGGSGGQLPTARDTRMIEKAVKSRWNIPDSLRAILPGVLTKIIADKETSPRNKIAAARVVLAADALNMEQEKRDAGGETLNVNHTGTINLTNEQRLDRLHGLAETIRRRRAGDADTN